MNVSKLIKILEKIKKENGPRTPVTINLDSCAEAAGGDYTYHAVNEITVDKIPWDGKGEGSFDREKTVVIMDIK